jgi:3-phenylpropionate/trans-cinnamate dioxygenase ferredoxin component
VRVDELVAGEPRLLEVAGTRVVVARVGDAVYACADTCAHRGGPLSEGRLYGTRLACPWHGWQYDVRTGQCVFPRHGGSVASYRVEIVDGEVWVQAC